MSSTEALLLERRDHDRVEFYRHHLSEADLESVKGVLRSVFLTTGPVTARFERAFEQYTGLSDVVALNSCTGALHLALLALGVGPGDEVITTPMTFIATATAILHTGARPVFVDVDPETALMVPEAVEAAVTERTRAIMPVHLYGTMVDMRALREVADRHGLAIVEDSAHCIEAERDGARPGQLGDACCFSFYATKNLACGEGGAVAVHDPALAEKIRVLRLHGMSKDAAGRYHGDYQHWDMIAEGWKYNLSDIQAALLVNQLDRLPALWERRHEIWTRYDEGFGGLAGLETPRVVGRSAYHLYTIWVDPDRRDAVLKGLQDEGIGVAVNYRAIHGLTFCREKYGFVGEDFPVAQRIGASTISLPFYPSLTEEEIEHVIRAVRKVVGSQ